MATYYSQGTGLWSTLSNWDTNTGGGGSDPASVDAMDNNTFIIQAGHTITLDVDMSAFANGLTGLTITGGVTPGMLVSKYDADGTYCVKIKTGAYLVGTLDTNRGRILANSDGVWGNTGALPYGRKFIIMLVTTASITGTNLDIKLYCTQPTNKWVATYGTMKGVSSINTGTDVITLDSAAWALNTPIMVRSSGTLPAPLKADTVYYSLAPSGNTMKLACVGSGAVIDITSEGSGTIEFYDGHSSTSTGVMNVLTDVTGDEQWVNGATLVLSDTYSAANVDQQRSTISAVAAGTITLGNNVDSAQYPGARIYLTARNVAIRSSCASSSTRLLDNTNNTTGGSYLRCEMLSTAGTYGYGIYGGTGHEFAGILTVSSGLVAAVNYTLSGIAVSGSYGIYQGSGSTMSGLIDGMTYGVGSTAGAVVSGTIMGCTSGIATSLGVEITETASVSYNTNGVSGCYGTIINGLLHQNSYGVTGGASNWVEKGIIVACNYAFSATDAVVGAGARLGYLADGTVMLNLYDFGFSQTSELAIKLRGPMMPASPATTNRNYASSGKHANSRVQSEDHAQTPGDHRTYYQMGDVIKNTSILRTGGASSTLEVVPLSNCSVNAQIPIFEWTEIDVPASSQTRSVYMKGESLAAFPDNTELYFEAEYISDDNPYTHATEKSTAVLTDNTTWVEFSVTFTPHIVGIVRYRAYLKFYDASGDKVYVDNMLNAA